MSVDPRRIYELVLPRMIEVAEYQKEMCGKVVNIGKEVEASIASPAGTALTYMDTFTQDYLMLPIFAEFPDLVPLVEEDTGLKRKYINNHSEDVLLLDPIDGTKCYVEGTPDYSIMMGMMTRGEMVAAVTMYPETKEVYAAVKGQGAWKVDGQSKIKMLEVKKGNPKKIDSHYRFLKDPFTPLSDRLKEKGYRIGTNFVDFGTNLTGILNVLDESCAFIAPHTSIHDFAAAGFIIQQAGGAVRLFDGKDDFESWRKTDNKYHRLDPHGPSPRYRAIIAEDEETIERIIKEMS